MEHLAWKLFLTQGSYKGHIIFMFVDPLIKTTYSAVLLIQTQLIQKSC